MCNIWHGETNSDRVIRAEENHKRDTLYTETESKTVMQNVQGLFTDVYWLGLGPFIPAKQVRAESTHKELISARNT